MGTLGLPSGNGTWPTHYKFIKAGIAALPSCVGAARSLSSVQVWGMRGLRLAVEQGIIVKTAILFFELPDI